jgi:hypothetical protein
VDDANAETGACIPSILILMVAVPVAVEEHMCVELDMAGESSGMAGSHTIVALCLAGTFEDGHSEVFVM